MKQKTNIIRRRNYRLIGLIIGIILPFVAWILAFIFVDSQLNVIAGILLNIMFSVCIITGYHGHPPGCQMISLILSPLLFGIIGLFVGNLIEKGKIRKPPKIILKILIAIVILFTLYLLFFIGRSSKGKITQDSSTMKRLCSMQKGCQTMTVPLDCEELDYIIQNKLPIEQWDHKMLVSWEGYHGCNESTTGYNDGVKVIFLEYCHCK